RLLCGPCAAHLRPLGPPECDACGRPGARAPCRDCGTDPSPIRRARAWAEYHDPTGSSPVARAIAAFKYRGAQRLGRRFAAAMLPRIPDPSVALIVPVPLHPRRLRARGFNQSAVLARHVARALGRTAALTVLARTRDTPSQTSLTPAERA